MRDWLRAAARIAVLTGAGVSAESGVPTFRDADRTCGRAFGPDLATEAAFRRDPARVWAWYAGRRSLQDVQPNAGHLALAAFAQRHPGRLTLITQNVDGLHQRAGSEGVLCLHGDLFENRWLDMPRDCCRIDDACAGHPPYCDRCGNLVRPGVVWFGEPLPFAALDGAQRAVRACEVMLVVGTSGQVQPAGGLATLASGGRPGGRRQPRADRPGRGGACHSGRPSARLIPELLDF